MSEDGLTYTFTLKEGLKWSDGEELNAEDVVYSWNRLVTPETGADYSYLADIDVYKRQYLYSESSGYSCRPSS